MLTKLPHRIFLLLLIAALHSYTVAAQLPDYQLHLMPQQEGLKTAAIMNMAKDKDGFLWLLSQSLVQRFDGRHTLHFPFEETIDKIYIDTQGRKWVMSRKSIYLLKNIYHGFVEIGMEAVTDGSIIHIYESGENLCIARTDGHYIFNRSLNKFQRHTAPVFAQGIDYTKYFGKHGNEIYFGKGDSIYCYSYDDKRIRSAGFKKESRVLPVGKYELLVSTSDFKTFYINMVTGMVKPLNPMPAQSASYNKHFFVFGVSPLDDHRFLISSNSGLMEYNCTSQSFSTPSFYLNGRRLDNAQSSTYMYNDPHGTIYMSHAEGIIFMNGRTKGIKYLKSYSDGKNQWPGNDVRNFAEDGDGNIWMATTNGITRLNTLDGQLKNYETPGKGDWVDFPSYRQLLYDSPYLWIGTSGNGVWLLNTMTGRYSRPIVGSVKNAQKPDSVFNATYVWKILKLNDGRFFVAGGGRCYIVYPESLKAEKISFRTSSLSSRSALQDSSGRIWHGTSRGLSCNDNNFNTLFFVRDSFPDKRIASFCEWKKNSMLVGSKGLFEIEVKGDKIISFRKRNGIPANRLIYCMKQDPLGYVWMGTDDGLFRYDPIKDESILFDQGDFVQSQAFNSDAAFLSTTGLLFLGGRNGINYFDPATLRPASVSLKPIVSYFAAKSDDSSYHIRPTPLIIPYNSRDIDFLISCPEYRKPYRLQYRYRLDSNNKDWSQVGFNDRVRINNLQPGNYYLQVSASYDGVNWFDSSRILPFAIMGPWWKSWWFRTISLAFIASIIWFTFRHYRIKREALENKRIIEYFANSSSEHSSTEDILWDIARNCISRLGFEDCVIYLVDEQRNMLVQRAAYGDKSPKDFEIINPIEIPIGMGITGTVAKTGESLIIQDTSKDLRYIVDDERRASELTVPIIHEGKVIGVIDSEHRKANFFKETHLRTIKAIAEICSTKISKAIANEAVRKAELELSLLNNKMMESKFKNLRLQMNPHFLFNILTTIQYLIVSQQTNKASSYLNIFSGFLRSILQYAENTVVSLQEELRILKMYIELESLCLDETFTWNVDVAGEIDQEEVQVPFMLLQPFVENAIHHGLMQKPGEKKFSIRIQESGDEYFTCIIEDNGVGRLKAASINGRNLSSVIHKSKGVDIVKQRLELMQQKTEKRAGVEIEDLYDGNEPTGTRVRIFISYYSKEEI